MEVIVVKDNIKNSMDIDIDNIFLSERKIPLSYFGGLPEKGQKIIAVELYAKWYSFYEIDHNGNVEKSPLAIDTMNIGFLDHTWNPQDLINFVDGKEDDYYLPELTIELLIGRWEMESKENYIPQEV